MEFSLLENITYLKDLKNLIKKDSSYDDLDVIINENLIKIEIYNIMPMAILTTFKCFKLKGFSKHYIYTQIYKKLKNLYANLNPENKNIWGLKFKNIKIEHISYYPKLKKIEVSIS